MIRKRGKKNGKYILPKKKLFHCWGKNTFVVLYLVGVPVVFVIFPLFKLRQRIEADLFLSFGRFDDGRNKFLEERESEKRRPVVVDEVNEETLNMRPVLVLICHDHELAVTETLQVVHGLVFLLVLETHDLDNIVNFGILHDLFHCGFTSVQHFT